MTTLSAVENHTALFTCASHGDGCSLAFRVHLFPEGGGAPSDCARYGHNVALAWPNDGACTDFGAEVHDFGEGTDRD